MSRHAASDSRTRASSDPSMCRTVSRAMVCSEVRPNVSRPVEGANAVTGEKLMVARRAQQQDARRGGAPLIHTVWIAERSDGQFAAHVGAQRRKLLNVVHKEKVRLANDFKDLKQVWNTRWQVRRRRAGTVAAHASHCGVPKVSAAASRTSPLRSQ